MSLLMSWSLSNIHMYIVYIHTVMDKSPSAKSAILKDKVIEPGQQTAAGKPNSFHLLFL